MVSLLVLLCALGVALPKPRNAPRPMMGKAKPRRAPPPRPRAPAPQTRHEASEALHSALSCEQVAFHASGLRTGLATVDLNLTHLVWRFQYTGRGAWPHSRPFEAATTVDELVLSRDLIRD